MWNLKWRRNFVLVGAALLLASCSKPSSDTNSVPNAGPNPTTTPKTVVPITNSNPTTQSGLPSMTQAVELSLNDNTNYLGLNDIAGNIVQPVVWSKIQLLVTNTRSRSIGGDLLVTFEDSLGFWGWGLDGTTQALNSVPGTGCHDASGSSCGGGNALDMIFTETYDSTQPTNRLATFRVVGTQASDGTITAGLYYRIRQKTATDSYGDPVFDSNACWQYQPTTCTETYWDAITQTWRNKQIPYDPNICPAATQDPNFVNNCRAYMTNSSSSTAVKQLGQFKVNYSQISTLSEGN